MSPPLALVPRLRPARVLLVLTALAALAGATIWLALRGVESFPAKCLFHHWTGLHCPGCGMTRATAALLHGDFPAAFRLNGLGILLLPPALVGVALEAWAWVQGIPPRWTLRVGRHGAAVIAATVILFTVLRNLPWWPFTLLAPP